MRALLLTCAVALILPLAPATGEAQTLRINPRIGAYVPLTDLGTREDVAEAVALGNSLSFGLGVELRVPVLPFNLRANLDYASEATITSEGIEGDAGNTTVLAVTGDVVFRLPRFVVIQPYFFVGAGLKQYDFDTENTAAFRDASDPTLHLGGGIDLGFGALSLTAQLSDYISWYELQAGDDAQIQHDLFLSIGLAFGLF